ncbi:MAG: hypothetical protein M0021_09700 [Clostridia bacterium]|nr:hypothetical protein [Clostridia bacterium]
MPKEEGVLVELTSLIRHTWRHRPGNEIPGLILDTFDNLRFETKDKRRPVMVSKQKTPYGWYLVFNLPPGISFKQCKAKENFFSDAVKGFVNMTWNGQLHMEIQTSELPNYVEYAWDSGKYEHMELPIPIGCSQKGLEVFDLCDSPHLLVGGQTGWGKTMFLHCLANALIPRAWVCISDPKRLDFRYLGRYILLARDDEEAQGLLKALLKEYGRRIALLEQADVSVTKIQEYDSTLPYIVAIFDEVAQISKESMEMLTKLAQLARAVGIHLVAATQRPDVSVIPGQCRDLFEARMCFKVGSEISSRVILGEECSKAAWLPAVKGRAIFRFGGEFKEVQTMCLSKEQRKKIAFPERGWEFEQTTKRLFPR